MPPPHSLSLTLNSATARFASLLFWYDTEAGPPWLSLPELTSKKRNGRRRGSAWKGSSGVARTEGASVRRSE